MQLRLWNVGEREVEETTMALDKDQLLYVISFQVELPLCDSSSFPTTNTDRFINEPEFLM